MTADETEKKDASPPSSREKVLCPLCGNEMTYIQVCHLRCNVCGTELSCEDKGWFWG